MPEVRVAKVGWLRDRKNQVGIEETEIKAIRMLASLETRFISKNKDPNNNESVRN